MELREVVALRPNMRDPGLDARSYRLGMWSFVLQRTTGVILTLYLFLHLWIIAQVTGASGKINFTALARILERPPYLYLDLGLVALVLFHAANGLRLILFELDILAHASARVFWMLAGIGLVLFVLGGWAMLAGGF